MTVEEIICDYLARVSSASRAELQRDLPFKADTINHCLSRVVRRGYVRQCSRQDKRGDSIKPARPVLHFMRTEKPYEHKGKRRTAKTSVQPHHFPLASAVLARHVREASCVPRELIAAVRRMVRSRDGDQHA